MSSSRVRSKTGCLTCKNRRKKCDEKRPICERCTRAGMECLGYSYLDEAADRTKRPREKPTSRVSRSVSDAAGPSRRPKAKFIVGPSVLPSSSSSLVLPWNNLLPSQVDSATSGFCTSPSEYSQWNLDQNTSTPLPDNTFDLSFLSDPSTALFEVQPAVEDSWEANSVNPRPSIQQPQGPPDGFGLTLDQSPSYLAPTLSDLHNPTLAPHSLPSASPTNTTPCMTAGQASLFQALFSLGHPQTDSPQSPDYVSQTSPSSHGSPWPSPDTEQDEDSSATSEDSDPEGIREIICRTPTIDRNVPTNSLAFVLSSYSKWMTRTVFEPLKMANQARQYLTRKYVQSEDSRWTVTLIANIVRLLTSSAMLTNNYLPTISMLQQRVSDSLTLVKFRPDPSLEARKQERQDALDDLLGVVPILCLTSPLPNVLALLHEAAPVFRSICDEPLGEPISLPRKLIDPEFCLRQFPAMDILFGACLCKPMIFQYDVSYSSDMCEGLTDSDVLGLQWMHGIPDQFIMMLARINMLRQESGATWDANTVLELETEIKEFKPVLGQSTDALLSVGRLAVQESWRQAMYVYLYMGLCGANAVDCRVKRAFKGFIKLVEGIRPGRTPDAFLMIPMIILGVAARRQRDRDLIHRRQTSVRECSQANTPGHQSHQALLDIWSRTDAEGRPAVWGDLRLAHARVAGV